MHHVQHGWKHRGCPSSLPDGPSSCGVCPSAGSATLMRAAPASYPAVPVRGEHSARPRLWPRQASKKGRIPHPNRHGCRECERSHSPPPERRASKTREGDGPNHSRASEPGPPLPVGRDTLLQSRRPMPTPGRQGRSPLGEARLVPRLVLPASAYVWGRTVASPRQPSQRRRGGARGRWLRPEPDQWVVLHPGREAAPVPSAGGGIRRGGDPCNARPLLVPPPAELDEKAAFRMSTSGRQGSRRGLHRPNGATSRRLEGVRVFWGCGPPKQPRLQLSPVPAPSLAAHASGPEGVRRTAGSPCDYPRWLRARAFTVAQSQGWLSPTTGGVTGRAGSTVWQR